MSIGGFVSCGNAIENNVKVRNIIAECGPAREHYRRMWPNSQTLPPNVALLVNFTAECGPTRDTTRQMWFSSRTFYRRSKN